MRRYGVVILAVLAAGCSRPPAVVAPEPAAVELRAVALESGHVRLEWELSGATASSLAIQRRLQERPWKAFGVATPEPGGRFVFVDPAAVSGQSYGYRVVLPPGAPLPYGDEVRVDVP